MATFEINEALARKIREIAAREKRTVDEVLAAMVATYQTEEDTSSENPLEAFVSLFPDSDVTDASTSVRESMARYYESKHERTD